MKRLALSMAISIAAGVFGAGQTKRIGEIEFFGYTGIDLGKVRSALPFHEGDEFDVERGGAMIDNAPEALRTVTGHGPTDITLTCCDSRGDFIVFIGLAGKSVSHDPQPNGTARLPVDVTGLYERFMDAWSESVQKGRAAEDWTKGYGLSEYPPLQQIELEIRTYALDHAALLGEVLATSADDQQHISAAAVLGYAGQSRSQLASLARAARDPNPTVRNNATRALMVLAGSNTKVAAQIPASHFVEMLLSGIWTDLNKSSVLLSAITKNRDSDLLRQLRRKEVVDRLIEMARWRTGHEQAAQYILGRLAGIDEEQLGQLVNAGKVEAIIAKVDGADLSLTPDLAGLRELTVWKRSEPGTYLGADMTCNIRSLKEYKRVRLDHEITAAIDDKSANEEITRLDEQVVSLLIHAGWSDMQLEADMGIPNLKRCYRKGNAFVQIFKTTSRCTMNSPCTAYDGFSVTLYLPREQEDHKGDARE